MTRTVIGPISPETWYCMRQCSEILRHLKSQNNPKFDLEIKGETELYNMFMDEALGRKAA